MACFLRFLAILEELLVYGVKVALNLCGLRPGHSTRVVFVEASLDLVDAGARSRIEELCVLSVAGEGLRH